MKYPFRAYSCQYHCIPMPTATNITCLPCLALSKLIRLEGVFVSLKSKNDVQKLSRIFTKADCCTNAVFPFGKIPFSEQGYLFYAVEVHGKINR
jgi:hypothetical protein